MAQEKLLGDPILDGMMSVVMRLARELYVTRDRLEIMERLMQAKGVLGQEEIDQFEPDEQAQAQLRAKRDEFVASILEPLTKREGV